MASKLLPATPRPKMHTRTVSLDSGGRLAVPKFTNGNCVEIPQKSLPERRPPRPSSMEQKRALTSSRGAEAQDDHSKVKEQLAAIERSKSSLMQDLARAKRNVDDLTTKLNGVTGSCRKDRVRTVQPQSSIAQDKDGWQVELDAMKQQYEWALTELQTSKQAMESLKHELMVCVEAKDEAVRLAGEAMNAAESTARRVEELSAELFTTKGSVPAAGGCATSQMDDLIVELPGASKSLLEVDAPLTEEKTIMPVVEGSVGEYFPEPSHNARAEVSDEWTEAVKMKDQEINHLPPPLNDLHRGLGTSKDADQKASEDLLAMQAIIQRSKLEAEEAKSAESVACSLLAKVSIELEAAEEKLVRASIEDAILVASLGFLKAQLEKCQQEGMEAQGREIKANSKVAELTECMSNVRLESQAELVMYKERETSTLAKIETLEMELEKCRSELVMVAERETVAAAKVVNMIEEMNKSKTELIELRKHSTYEVAALRAKLEEKEAKLVSLEERESIGANKIMALTLDLETKQTEVRDLQQQLLRLESKAEAVSMELSTLQKEVTHLAAREEEATAQVAALKGEVLELQKDLKKALNLGQGAREDLHKLKDTLQQAMLDRDEATCELQTAYCQLECSKRKSEDVLAESQASKKELEIALEVMRTAMEELVVASKLAKEEAQVAREEARAAEERSQTTMKHAEIVRTEIEKISKEAQSARDDAEFQKAALGAEKERVNAIEEEARAVLNEMVELKSEVTKLQADAEEAKAARADAESRFQDSRKELEAQKASAIQAERHAGHLSQEELTCLKEKLQGCEEQLHVATSEVDALQMDKARLLSELETVKAEREASKRAVLEAHQHLADLEKAKRVMEADIQRLLDDSKLWKAPKDARDILVLSEVNGNSYALTTDSREEKPQPESPDLEAIHDVDMAGLLMDREESKEEVHVDKEQETGTPMEETPSRVAKKKKHALLHRLHSYLDKKKSANT